MTPTRISASALDEVRDLVAISGWPMLGVVTYELASFLHRAAEHVNAQMDDDGATAPASSVTTRASGGVDQERGAQ